MHLHSCFSSVELTDEITKATEGMYHHINILFMAVTSIEQLEASLRYPLMPSRLCFVTLLVVPVNRSVDRQPVMISDLTLHRIVLYREDESFGEAMSSEKLIEMSQIFLQNNTFLGPCFLCRHYITLHLLSQVLT